MAAQLSLEGLEIPSEPTDRLLLGVIPDSVAADRMKEMAFSLGARHGLTGSLVDANRLHVTLCHIGDYHGLPKHFVESAKETAAKIKLRSFDAVFDRVMSFRGSKAFVLRAGDDNVPLHELRLAVFKALKTYGPGCLSGPTFTPHITLLYDNQTVAEHPVEPVSFKVHEFVLIHSLLRRSTHIHLARYPLLG